MITAVVLIFVSTFTTEFLTMTHADFKQAPEMYQSMGVILTLYKFLLHTLHICFLEYSSKVSDFYF